jgi:hypothetical protein
LHSILKRLKHGSLKEFDLPLHVEGLNEPLNLAKEVFFVLWLMAISIRDEVNQCDPVALYQGKQQVVQEGLAILLSFIFRVNAHCVLELIVLEETSLSKEFHCFVQVTLSF